MGSEHSRLERGRGREVGRESIGPSWGRRSCYHVELLGSCDEAAAEANAEAQARPPAQEHHPQEQVECECALLCFAVCRVCAVLGGAVLCCIGLVQCYTEFVLVWYWCSGLGW